ncbi:rhamnulokinase [Aquibacillus saliphilus]|uniref:rhamnulokinase n=1 Tax=Aquibacillus saliphilus TaxID=1909422 RepID=UPI001CF0D4B0|nr:rhamnulokinase family protein [Aquibacillus saliphilus]
MKKVWTFDIGASNGRLMLNTFDGQTMNLEEIYRFPNHPVHVTGNYYWDILNLFTEIKKAMLISVQKGHDEIESMGIDTWGVDFGLLSNTGELLGNPYSYRNPKNARGMEKALEKISSSKLFELTGVETAPINTLFQLNTIKEDYPELLDKAETLLFTPNLLVYLFTGVKSNEFTISSTSQMLSAGKSEWDVELLNTLGIDKKMLAPIVEPLTIAGETLSEINDELQIKPVKVINVPGHDTACALAALPLTDDGSAFMSCGTWVLIGVPVDHPVTNSEAESWGFTNEGTLEGKYRLQKNNMGMWLLQQCRVIWEREGIETNYEEENCLFEKTEAFRSYIDPDAPRFFNPDNMVEAIRSFCKDTQQPIPETRGQLIRCILESLALKYYWVINRLEHLTGKKIKRIHMGGGAIRNKNLCQLTANATNREVLAGPIESSSIGNAVAQWIALGDIDDLQEARKIVKKSFEVKSYEPESQQDWGKVYKQFLNFID